ncbi:ornithine decarboxylase antizyme with +1 programmed ribosomal shift Spa1 [Mortierella alpina]|nr:ornithine decarboxylase antizyme with +1 programmed ribosomal shift Spa1 [Mortierella alpina]
MERHAVLRTLRNGELPPDFVSRWPKEAAFVLWLMAENPEMRPTAREILDFDLIHKSKEDPATFSSTPTPTFTTATPRAGEADSEHPGRNAANPAPHDEVFTQDIIGDVAEVEDLDGLGLLVSDTSAASALTSSILKSVARVICEGCQSRCRCFEPLSHQGANSEIGAGSVNDESEAGGHRHCIDSLKGNNSNSNTSSNRNEKSKRQPHRGHRSTKSTSSSTLLTSRLPRTELEQKLSEESEKVQRLEMSMAAIRAENRALMDRIQQLEYEKEMSCTADDTGDVDEDDNIY